VSCVIFRPAYTWSFSFHLIRTPQGAVTQKSNELMCWFVKLRPLLPVKDQFNRNCMHCSVCLFVYLLNCIITRILRGQYNLAVLRIFNTFPDILVMICICDALEMKCVVQTVCTEHLYSFVDSKTVSLRSERGLRLAQPGVQEFNRIRLPKSCSF
jgi:hypothetical protein